MGPVQDKTRSHKAAPKGRTNKMAKGAGKSAGPVASRTRGKIQQKLQLAAAKTTKSIAPKDHPVALRTRLAKFKRTRYPYFIHRLEQQTEALSCQVVAENHLMGYSDSAYWQLLDTWEAKRELELELNRLKALDLGVDSCEVKGCMS